MQRTFAKRLIEVDLPIKRISVHARREKPIRHGHISTLHIWWARRPLAGWRALFSASGLRLKRDPQPRAGCPGEAFKRIRRRTYLARMSVGSADSSASTVSSRDSTDYASRTLCQIWYRRVYGRAHSGCDDTPVVWTEELCDCIHAKAIVSRRGAGAVAARSAAAEAVRRAAHRA